MRIITVTGPESSGKTTLARDLAHALPGAMYVPEFARVYLSSLGRTYNFQEFVWMLSGQRAWQSWYAKRSPSFLICDTDDLVYHIWAQERYGHIPEVLTHANQEMQAEMYLLCTPDMPWEPDPLREHPHERSRLFVAYQNLLDAQKLPYLKMVGDRATRLQMCLSLFSAEV